MGRENLLNQQYSSATYCPAVRLPLLDAESEK